MKYIFTVAIIVVLFITFYLVKGEKPKCLCPPDTTIPPEKAKLHICAFHLAKDDPKLIVETQHYCVGLSDELFQCVLYDSTGKNARLLGVEYVVSDNIFQKMSEEEKKLWHPHEYEVKNGLLIALNQPEECEKKLMTTLVGSWGKTWHTWGDTSSNLPLGLPRLMWSATKDDDIPKIMIKTRDEKFGIDTEKIRSERLKYLK